MKLLLAGVPALALSLLTPSTASALSQRGRQIDGSVVRVEFTQRNAMIAQTSDQRQLSFQWNNRTDFVRGASFTDAKTALKAGNLVRVTYHRPFFGPATVSRVVLVRSARCCSRC
ncbi:MAG: hypothetical protein JSR82_10080 [Verrucomicrobia bacterium]|nr:hypothetical protein [Verrucomicrobiota bacterium]